MFQSVQKLQQILKTFKWIDVVGVGIFFLIIATAGFFFLRRADYVTLTLRVSQSDSLDIWASPPAWYVAQLHSGLSEKDGLGRTVLSIDDVSHYATSEDNQITYVTLNMRALYNKKTNQYSYNGVPLLIGSYQSFKVGGIELRGVIHSIASQKSIQTKTVILHGYLDPSLDPSSIAANSIADGVPLYLSQKIDKGQAIQDNKGNNIAEIIEIKKTPGTRKFIYNNQVIKGIDSDTQRVDITLKVQATPIGDSLFFKKAQVIRVGSTINLDFQNFGVQFRITDFSEEQQS
jgi:hypothetical protein